MLKKQNTINTKKHTTPNFAIVLLAAGASNRLGKPKQLLPFNGRSFLQHNINIALNSFANEVVVVLGANSGLIFKEIDTKGIHLVMNPDWQEGMASSIRHGLNVLQEIAPSAEGVIFMVCDQPYVTPSLLNSLFTTHLETGKPIVACSYANTFGPPAFFHKTVFPNLLQLSGDTGARKIIQQHPNETITLPFPNGHIDIDTPSDYENLSHLPSLHLT